MSLKNYITECVILASNLTHSIKAETYLTELTEVAQENYVLFRKFACACSDSLLAVLYRLGHFGGDAELLNIAAEIIFMREAFGHEEKDVAGHIAHLIANHGGNQSTGNYLIQEKYEFYIIFQLRSKT